MHLVPDRLRAGRREPVPAGGGTGVGGPGGAEEPGCGCRTAGSGSAQSRSGWALLALLLPLAWRRRGTRYIKA